MQIDRHREVLVGLHQPVGAGGRLGMAGDEFLDAQHLVEPRLPFRHRRRPGLERPSGRCGRCRRTSPDDSSASTAPAPSRPPTCRDFRSGRDCRASRPAPAACSGSSSSVLNAAGDFSVFRNATMSLISWSLNKPWRAPGRHHRLGIVDARVVDVVEQPLVLAAGVADFGQIGRRHCPADRRRRPAPSHDRPGTSRRGCGRRPASRRWPHRR